MQGITEFFPISSTAHLILVPWFFGWKGDVTTLSFDIALHSGTLLALILFFLKDWIYIVTRKPQIFLLILIATIPGALAGFFFSDLAETVLRSPVIISISLITIGIYMLLSERVTGSMKRLAHSSQLTDRKSELTMKKVKDSIDDVSILDAVFIGLSQAIALIPGVSRSAITISTGLFRGMARETAARFSFLMATPIIAGATIYEYASFVYTPTSHDMTLFVVGIAVSFVSGIFAIQFLLNFFRKFSMSVFVYYRFVLSGIIVSILWIKG